ncbi:MAG: LamG-like jellyroll fold domain-containing protein, partial [Lentisphaeria bacterium]
NIYNNLIDTPLYDFSTNQSPDQSLLISSFSHQLNKDHYGEIISGYLIPPFSGYYSFYIAADEQAQLLISSNQKRQNLYTIANCQQPVAFHNWLQYPEQKSENIYLTAGKAYFIEARLKESTGSDHISVAWQHENIPLQVISGAYTSPIPTHFSQFLQAHWTFNEISDNKLLDSSGNNFHANVSNGTIVEGTNSSALNFKAETHVNLPVEPFNNCRDEYSISFFANNLPRSSTQILLRSYYSSSTDGSIMLPSSSYKNIFFQSQQAFTLHNCNDYTQFKNWHFWTITKNAALNQLAIYCDGQLIAQNTPNKNFVDTPLTSVQLGKKTFDYGGDFVGDLDELKLFSKTLSET